MAMSLQEIQAAALELPEHERAELIEALSATLEDADPELMQAWVAEADRRWRDIQSGKMETVPLEEVRRKIEARRNAQR